MTITFKTETGSEYQLDKNLMTWRRMNISDESGTLRNEYGKLERWPDIVLHEQAILYVAPHPTTPDGYSRVIITSPVVSIKYPLQ